MDKGNVIMKPPQGDRFVWVIVTLRNDQNTQRKFSWDRCDLDSGDNAMLPGVITHDFSMGYDTELSREPALDPGESIDRKLVFVYPQHQSPTRLKCAPMEAVPLPQF